MEQQPFNNNDGNLWVNNRSLFKGFFIAFTTLLLLIPSAFIRSLVSERQMRQQEAIAEVSSKWGQRQMITGPIIMIPYLAPSAEPKAPREKHWAYFLPEQLNIQSKLDTEERNRTIYRVTLYKTNLKVEGKFKPLTEVTQTYNNVEWQYSQAQLLMGISDVRGLSDEVSLQWSNNTAETINLNTGVPNNQVINAGMSLPFDATPLLDKETNFNIEIHLKGSDYLQFVPVGRTTQVAMQSPWKDPAFDGSYLPDSKTIDSNGFTANWKILHVTRNFPQYWSSQIGSTYNLESSAFGVKLLQPTDNYSKTDRSIKYAILFIALTFTFFFFVEMLQKKSMHPLQYILVGFALCIFYTLLLSISEYLGFNKAYLIAAFATITLITSYVHTQFQNKKTTSAFFVTISGLYLYIFVLIQLQDYALLCGSIGLFIIIAFIMHYSQRIQWSPTDTQRP